MSKDNVAESLHPRHLPMLVKPKPWLSYNSGGYLYSRSWAMRFKDSREQEVYLRHASEAGQLELIFAGLDVLYQLCVGILLRCIHHSASTGVGEL